MEFLNSLQSEWLKRRRSAATWLTLFGGLFVPVLVLIARLIRHNPTMMANATEGIWVRVYDDCWQYMSFFLLPMGITLAASLIAQIEYRNNTWKQTLTTPQGLSTIFWAKYVVVLAMLVQFFILFNIGIAAAVLVPAVVYTKVPFPRDAYPFMGFLYGNAKFFVCCLPVLALQYLLSTHIRNFIIPIVAGFALVIASLMATNWEHGYLLPYAYAPLQFLKSTDRVNPTVNLFYWAIGYFILFTLLNYFLFINKNRRIGLFNINWKWFFTKKGLFFLLGELVLCIAIIVECNSKPIVNKIENNNIIKTEQDMENSKESIDSLKIKKNQKDTVSLIKKK